MAWGTIDDSEFEAFVNKVTQKIDSGELRKGIEQTGKRVGTQALRQVKEITPTGKVDGGTLKRNWSVVGPSYNGNAFVIELINNTEYASYVEDGHRQTPGRYVPAIGKRLKASWVPGTHMLMKTMFEVDAQMPQLLSPVLRDLGGLFD